MEYNLRKTLRVTFNIPAAPSVYTKYFLPNDPEVNNNILRGIQVFKDIYEIKDTFNISGANAPLTQSQIKNSFLTLCNSKGEEIYKQVCMTTFIAADNRGIVRDHYNARIDVSKSFIQFTDIFGINSGSSYLLMDFLLTPAN